MRLIQAVTPPPPPPTTSPLHKRSSNRVGVLLSSIGFSNVTLYYYRTILVRGILSIFLFFFFLSPDRPSASCMVTANSVCGIV